LSFLLTLLVKEADKVVQEFGSGWAMLQPFKELQFGKAMDTLPELTKNSLTQEGRINPAIIKRPVEFNLRKGTPHALSSIHAETFTEDTYRLGCKGFYALFRHPGLKSAMHVIRENDFVTDREYIPGMIPKCGLMAPKLQQESPIQLNTVSVSLPVNFETRLLTSLEEHRRTEHNQHINKDKKISVARRTLLIGVHNTYTFIKPPRIIPMDFELDEKGDVRRLKFDGSLVFPLFYLNDMCGIVIELQYVLEVPSVVKPKKQVKSGIFGRKKNAEVTLPEVEYENHVATVGTYVYHVASKNLDGVSRLHMIF
jgi:hypothetical protein